MNNLQDEINQLQKEVYDIQYKINQHKYDCKTQHKRFNGVWVEKMQLAIKTRNIRIGQRNKDLADIRRAERLERHNSTEKRKREGLFVGFLRHFIAKEIGEEKQEEIFTLANELAQKAELTN
jgi:hypothetical protein